MFIILKLKWKIISDREQASFTRIISFDSADFNFEYPIGWVKDFYNPSGNLQWKGKYSYYDVNNEDNKNEGLATWYYDKPGKIKSRESNYYDGKLEGETIFWHENGEAETVLFYKDNKLEGTVKRYDNQGNLFSKAEYISGKVD